MLSTTVRTEISEMIDAYKQAEPEVQQVIREMLEIAVSSDSDEQERQMAETTLLEGLFPIRFCVDLTTLKT